MRLIANYHTHTELCGHAIGMTDDYVQEALKAGFKELGMSDHGPIPRSFMSAEDYHDNYLERQMDEGIFRHVYLPDLEQAIRQYGQRIKLWKGVEIEYLPGHDDYFKQLSDQLDYLSLGMHFFPYAGGLHNSYDIMDNDHVLNYAENVAKAVDTGLFTILNHPDLYLFMHRRQDGAFKFGAAAEAAARIIIEACIRNRVFLEINGGGLRRGLFLTEGLPDYAYPRRAFWNIVAQYKEARIVIGCDTHNPIEIYDETIEAAIRFAESFPFSVVKSIDFDQEKKQRKIAG